MKPVAAKRVAAALLSALLAACAGRPASAPEPGATVAAAPARFAGVYRLQSINDQKLPVLAAAWGDCREQIVSAGLALYRDRRYVLSGTARQACAGAPAVESRGGGGEGRYSVEGNIVRLDAATPIEGAAPPGWIDDHPGGRLSIGALVGAGLLDGDVLTLRLQGGGIATFRRTES